MKHIIHLTSLMLCIALLAGCAAQSASDHHLTAVSADYPEMAPYPDQSRFIDPVTGAYDDAGFSRVYEAWKNNRILRSDIPPDYAHSLMPYFQSCIPVFLNTGNDNSVCSPLNIYMATALLAEITGGDTRQEILDLLASPDLDTLRLQANQVWRAHYRADGSSACTLANSLWLSNSLTYNDDTATSLAANYYASVFQGAMGSPEMDQALQNWLNEQTQGLLQEQAADLQLDPQTALALASTVYYRAKWSDEFSPEQNTDGIFHAPTGNRTVTFLNQQLTYGPYYWGDDFGAVSLRLEDSSRMWLILPDEGKSPADLLSSGHALRLVLGGWLETEAQKTLRVNLSLPKFDTGSNLHLEEALQQLGICSVFHPNTADFSPLLSGQGAWLDAVNHAARVKIDEEGVEAAAYTVMIAPGAAMPPEDEIDFVLDRPFLFFITSQDQLPLFAGIINTP